MPKERRSERSSQIDVNRRIYNLCSCCDIFYSQKYFKNHREKDYTPQVYRYNWKGYISSSVSENVEIFKAFIDPDAFSISAFSIGHLVKLFSDQIVSFVKIYPSSTVNINEIHINPDYMLSYGIKDKSFISISDSGVLPIAKAIYIRVDCRKITNNLQEFINSRLNGLAVKQFDIFRLTLDSNIVSFKITSIINFDAIESSSTFSSSMNCSNLLDTSKSVLESECSSKFSLIDILKTFIYIQPDEKYSIVNSRLVSPPVDFNQFEIDGVEEHIKYLDEVILSQINKAHLYQELGLSPLRGVVLYGLPGSGKCSIIYKFCCLRNLSIVTFEAEEFMDEKCNIMSEFREFLSLSSFSENLNTDFVDPKIIFVKHIDRIATHDNISGTQNYVFWHKFNSSISQARGKIFIFTSKSKNWLSDTIRSSAFTLAFHEVYAPNDNQREIIISSKLKSTTSLLNPREIHDLANLTKGFTPRDLTLLFQHAAIESIKRYSNVPGQALSIIRKDFDRPLLAISPEVIRDTEIFIADTSWDDIGGMDSVKRQVQECIEWPWLHRSAFARMGILPPSGVLLYGPPGCSKTMIARALSKNSNLNFISIRGPEIVNMYVGETERAIRNLFEKARSASPCILFFDEIDSLCVSSKKNSDSNRILAQLLTELDGISKIAGSVFVVAATNKPHVLDPALLRPGRFDRLVYVPLPDWKSRESIINLICSKMPIDKNINHLYILEKTEKFSGSEITAIFREAAIFALKENIDSSIITMHHIDHILNKVKARISKNYLQIYEDFKNQYGDLAE